MSPRANPSSSSSNLRSSASAPYTRRAAGQPKSSRQQFSACGACRMRRVRCDLKDLPYDTISPHPACSNCRERGLKCVDEFAEVKAVKLLRRGRRLQQVEAIYGKLGEEGMSVSPPSSPGRSSSIIPRLHPDFFGSKFWQRFCVQRPILDPVDFSSRYIAHVNGSQAIGAEGQVIASLLVAWAYSFGVDEQGEETSSEYDSAQANSSRKELNFRQLDPERLETLNSMIKEILRLIDLHGVMRRPTWDGVRTLLLVMPLMDDVQEPVDRLVMYQSVLVQINSLATLASHKPTTSASLLSGGSDTLVNARVIWYAYVHEGITTGLHGGRLILEEEDLESFHCTVPRTGEMGAEGPSGLPSPISPSARLPVPVAHKLPLSQLNGVHHHIQPHQIHSRSGTHSHSQELFQAHHLFTIPVQLSTICRKIHDVLTGPKAKRRASMSGPVDEAGVREIWEGLERCWDQFESLRRGVGEDWDVERFVCGWKIFIFECFNIVREFLKQIIHSRTPQSRHESPVMNLHSSASSTCSSSSTQTRAMSALQLHASAARKCMRILPQIISMIKYHTFTQDQTGETGGLFKWDAGLVRDGCFFAGFLAAGGEADNIRSSLGHKLEESDASYIDEDSVAVCLQALREMRWECSKSEDRAQTVHMVLEARRLRQRQLDFQHPHDDAVPFRQPSFTDPQNFVKVATHIHSSDRPDLAPLAVSPHHSTTESRAAASPGWPLYTPPGTAGASASAGSPIHTNPHGPGSHGYKSDDLFYRPPVEIDPFNFSAPGLQGPAHEFVEFHQRSRQQPTHQSPTSLLDHSVFSGSSTMAHDVSTDVHQQYADDCHTFYH